MKMDLFGTAYDPSGAPETVERDAPSIQRSGPTYQSYEYRMWQRIKDRCSNTNSADYHNYGALGITFDPSWQYFRNFLQDMGLSPSRKHIVTRIDNDRDFSKENCRWAIMRERYPSFRHKHTYE
jgi:hypothetical protein